MTTNQQASVGAAQLGQMVEELVTILAKARQELWLRGMRAKTDPLMADVEAELAKVTAK